MPAQTLLSFRAGKMNRENETSNNIVADTRKGYIQLLNEDDLLHFQWKERSATDAEDDLIIFPEDAKFVPVAEAVDGRVYMLRFESSKAKHFFWMQDNSTARDEWVVDRLNTLINDPNAPATDMPNGETNPVAGVLNGFGGGNNANRGVTNAVSEELLNSTLAGFPGGAEAFWENMQGTGIGRDEFLQMLAGEMDQSGSIPQTPAASQQLPLFPQSSQTATQQSTQPTGTAALPADLQSQLASITAGLPVGGPGGARREYMSLNDVLTRDVLKRVLEMPGIAEQLRPGMPENWESEGSGGVEEVIQSPQFQQALSSLSSAISTGQLAPLLQQFGLEGGIDNVEAFLRAVEEQVRREQGGDGSGAQDEDRMQED